MLLCEAQNCPTEAYANGLCFKHYMRVRRHGSVTGGRNGDGRVKSAHPLWETYKSMTRGARRRGGLDHRWKDFWKFVEDVGAPPTERARLYRRDRAKPYGPRNWEWIAPILDAPQLANKAAASRAWRMKRYEKSRDWQLRRAFGITLARYNEMLTEQGGACALCRQPESAIDPRYGRPFPLAVDHCHKSDGAEKTVVRGLLCQACNRGLGMFADDPSRLRAAAAYLESHAGDKAAGCGMTKPNGTLPTEPPLA